MAASASLPFLSQPFTTSFNKQTTIKGYLISQTVFSTAFGFLVCRLPFVQSAALGLATEGCRYITDKAVTQLSNKFSSIKENRTAVKTALVAGSLFLAKTAINTILPGSSTLLGAALLMSTAYLAAEPIATRIYQTFTEEGKTVKQSLIDMKTDICRQYPAPTQKITNLSQKITNLWNQFFGSNGNRLDGNIT